MNQLRNMRVLEGPNSLYVLGYEFIHNGASDGNARQDRRHSESKSPVPCVCQDKASNKCSEEVDNEGNLFRYTLVDQV